MIALGVTTVHSSEGVVLPKEALAKLNVAKGDTLYLKDAPDGSMRITPQDPEFARKVSIIEDICARTDTFSPRANWRLKWRLKIGTGCRPMMRSWHTSRV